MFTEGGKIVVLAGLATVVIGLLMMMSDKAGTSNWLNWFGNLPLDIKVEKENFRFYFPIGSSIVLSILLSLALYLFNKFTR